MVDCTEVHLRGLYEKGKWISDMTQGQEAFTVLQRAAYDTGF